MATDFYVYVYTDPFTLEPFYIGKGYGQRHKKHLSEAKCWNGIWRKGKNCSKLTKIRDIWKAGRDPIITKVFTTSDEFEAYAEEKRLVELYRDKLTNIVDGGSGGRAGEFNNMYGKTHSEEARQKIRDVRAREKLNPNYLENKVKANPRSIRVTDGKEKYLSLGDYARKNNILIGVARRLYKQGHISKCE